MLAPQLPFLVNAEDAPGKQRILHAALRLFAHRGLDGTSIREIGVRARTTNPALYKHFENKDALAFHLFLVCYRELWERIAGAVAGQKGFERQLEAFVEAFVDYHDACPEAVMYIGENIQAFWPRVPPDMEPRSLTILARELIRRGEAEGAIPRGPDESVRVLGIVGQLFQLGRMIALELMQGPGRRWTPHLTRQIRRMLG
jgi:AcrR family transcriptional regulator